MDAWTIAGLWIVWTVYWFAASRGTKPVLHREGVAARLLHTLPYMLGLGLLALPSGGQGVLLPAWMFHRFMPDTDEINTCGAVAVAAGLGFAVWARQHLAGNWSNLVVLRQGHELITLGPYRLARHPIYSGILLAVMGTALARNDVIGVLATALVAAVVADQIAAEERMLVTVFGEAYARYQLAVPALVPRLRPVRTLGRMP